ncbi:MAG TPA: hypothetical protein VHP83_03580 [Aggregatilineaceae bacterium]|nr:hypothetical protein [Aggregatilineaceae bacterium]
MLEQTGQPEEIPPGPNPGLDKLKALLKSRKFWAALVAVVMIFVKAYAPNFPLSEEQLLGVTVAMVGYILGVAVEDGLTARAR